MPNGMGENVAVLAFLYLLCRRPQSDKCRGLVQITRGKENLWVPIQNTFSQNENSTLILLDLTLQPRKGLSPPHFSEEIIFIY